MIEVYYSLYTSPMSRTLRSSVPRSSSDLSVSYMHLLMLKKQVQRITHSHAHTQLKSKRQTDWAWGDLQLRGNRGLCWVQQNDKDVQKKWRIKLWTCRRDSYHMVQIGKPVPLTASAFLCSTWDCSAICERTNWGNRSAVWLHFYSVFINLQCVAHFLSANV